MSQDLQKSSQEMKNIINDLRMFQSYISVKLLNKFKKISKHNFNTEDEWGWFIEPEINNDKPFILKHFSTLTTIKEEKMTKEITKIRSIKSIQNFNYEFKQVYYKNNYNYIAIVGLTTLFSLIYIFMIL
jgi:hypothetical protein